MSFCVDFVKYQDMKKFLFSFFCLTIAVFATAQSQSNPIVIDFELGFDTTWVKKALAYNANEIYVNCGVTNTVLKHGVSAYWYSANDLQTHFEFGNAQDGINQTDTVPAFGAFDYDEVKIKNKVGSQYQWFVDNYGTKDLVVRLRQFKRGDEGRLLIFRSGLRPTSLTREKPLKVYWDKVHTTMGVEQVYRIEPADIPDSLQIDVTKGTSIYVTVERLSNGQYIPLVSNVVASRTSSFGLNLQDYMGGEEPLYVIVRRGTTATVSNLRLRKMAMPEPTYDTVKVSIDTIACQGSVITLDGKDYVSNASAVVYEQEQISKYEFKVYEKTYNIVFQTAPRHADTVYVDAFPYTCSDGLEIKKQGWLTRHYDADNICHDSIVETYYMIDENAPAKVDTTYTYKDTTLCAGSLFEWEGQTYSTEQTISYNTSIVAGKNIHLFINYINIKFFEAPRTVKDTVYVTSWPHIVGGKIVATKQGWVNDTTYADNVCGYAVVSTYYTLSASGYERTEERSKEIDTTLCEGTPFILEGSKYTKAQDIKIRTQEVIDKVLYITNLTYHLRFESVQRTVSDTVWVKKWPYKVNGKVVAEQQGWKNDTIYDASVCGYHLVATYYATEPVTSYVTKTTIQTIDTMMCEGSVFELEGLNYTANKNITIHDKEIRNDTIFIHVVTYRLRFEAQEIHNDTIYVRSFPATVDGITAQKAGWVKESIPADNVCGEIIYNHYFTYPRIDTVLNVEYDSVACEGTIVELRDYVITSDTSFTIKNEIDLDSVVQLSIETYYIGFDPQTIESDTVKVAHFPAVVDGVQVFEEGWIEVHKPAPTACLYDIYNHYCVQDTTIQWGKSCEYGQDFEYGYDKWLDAKDTLWFYCRVDSFLENGITAYWNPILEIDSVEIAIFLNCYSTPLQTQTIAYNRFYQLSPSQIESNYGSKIREVDVDEVIVRFVPQGRGELIGLKYGQYAENYVIIETTENDTACIGQPYVIGDLVIEEDSKIAISVRNYDGITNMTTVQTTIYNIVFIAPEVTYDTVWVEAFPYVNSEGRTIPYAMWDVEWVENGSSCGYAKQNTYYALINALSINQLDFVVRPTLAEAGEAIHVSVEGNNSLQVFDLLGRRIIEQYFTDQTTISLEHKGEYILRVVNNDGTGQQKLIIK